ncbi:MAG: RNA polymerase sigma factor [Candidatus Kapabacteria bacterium]|nr:RNA polymerase sigma factor [Candidatus Kapabacteria bacterium]
MVANVNFHSKYTRIVSFEEIYRLYQGLVYNLALQYIQNTEDAEEIMQDVFVAVYQSLHTFRNEAKPSTWIYRITINKSLDYIKAKKRKKRFGMFVSLFAENSNEPSVEPHSFHHPGVELEQQEAVERIFAVINRLPENQRTALILSKLEQMKQTEIAEIMNISAKAVESLIQRAKATIAKQLQHNSEGFQEIYRPIVTNAEHSTK